MVKLYPEFFRRLDERPDALFYLEPRCVRHLDEGAAQAVEGLYGRLLPRNETILDLMASYHSQLPETVGRVVGLGLNHAEMMRNSRLDDCVVQDLNRDATLPFADASFGGAVCTVSVQYLTRPDELFPELLRCLKPGAPFVVTFSNRMFPTKAILAWRASDDAAHLRLVQSYFEITPGFIDMQQHCYVPERGDPVYAVWAYKGP